MACFAQAALRHVDDALEGEVVGRLADDAEIGHGVADLGAFVEARAADDAIVEAERDKNGPRIRASWKGGAHQDRHVVEVMALAAWAASISSPTARASSSESQAAWTFDFCVVGVSCVGETASCEAALIVGDEVGGPHPGCGRWSGSCAPA